MIVYRYRAVPLANGAVRGAPLSGELAADSPADLRASLRRIGLQVIEAKPARPLSGRGFARRPWASGMLRRMHQYVRSRRAAEKAEFFDALATLMDGGLPIDEALAAIGGGAGRSRLTAMLAELRQHLRDGASLDESMDRQPSWFSPSEAAMARAARASGELPRALRSMAERHERMGALTSKLIGAILYPSIVLVAGCVVVMFLSVRTLPDLVAILRDAGIEPPRLTMSIMAVGHGLLRYGVIIAVMIPVVVVASTAAVSRLRLRGWSPPLALRRCVPRFVRRATAARAWANLAELIGTGVPLVDSLRLTAPAVRGAMGASLAAALDRSASAVERGSSFADSLADAVWFGEECRRLIAVGESAGELPDVLSRLAERTHRSAARAIDRASALVEPAMILLLAGLIGIVVVGAVLPIVKLQEIVG